jgi:hypothetical protein
MRLFGRSLLASVFLQFVLLGWLFVVFGRIFSDSSIDLAQHHVIVDEIMKHGGVRPQRLPYMAELAIYPRASHWLAAIVGWVGGSGLIGLKLVSIAAIYVTYCFINNLISLGGVLGVIVFIAIFLALSPTHAETGWEVVGNFFYPQLVGTAVFFGLLYWLAKSEKINPLSRVAVIALASGATMWAHALPAVHILVVGVWLTCFTALEERVETGRFGLRSVGAAALMLVLAGAVVAVHPAMRAMALIAQNDGYLVFSFEPHSIPAVVGLVMALGAFNLYRRLVGAGSYVDTVLGSAALASSSLLIAQYAMLAFVGAGTPYAVKKHLFIVVTLGAMNSARLIAGYIKPSFDKRPSQFVPSIAAAFATAWILWGVGKSAWPTLEALRYANYASEFGFSGFKPGNTIDADVQASPVERILVSSSALQYPLGPDLWAMLAGPIARAEYVMVRNTPSIDQSCPQRFSESAIFVVVPRACLGAYVLATPVSFAIGGESWRYESEGWSGTEAWGTWSLAKPNGEILIRPMGSSGDLQLSVAARAFVNAQHPRQVIRVVVNNVEVAVWTFAEDSWRGQKTALIPATIATAGELRIVFQATDAVSPAQLGLSGDSRLLGIGVESLMLSHTH